MIPLTVLQLLLRGSHTSLTVERLIVTGSLKLLNLLPLLNSMVLETIPEFKILLNKEFIRLIKVKAPKFLNLLSNCYNYKSTHTSASPPPTGEGYSLIKPIRVSTAGQGLVFGLSVLVVNRVYNVHARLP